MKKLILFIFISFSLILHLLIGLIPIFANEETGFWQHNRYFFQRFLSSVLYAAFLFIGISLALGAVTYLFNMKIRTEMYGYLFVVCVCVFQTWYFLGGLPKQISDFSGWTEYPGSLRIITQYLFIPLVTLYSVILYAYLGKIIFLWSLPKGFVGWLVSIMSTLGILNLLLLDPIKNKSESSWVRSYSKYFYILLIPLLAMLFIGICTRIREYGFTEKRYMLLSLALWFLGISLYFIFSKKKLIKWVPISLGLLVFLSSFGPWGAYQFSESSQLSRFKKIASANDIKLLIYRNDNFYKLERKDRVELSSIADYLAKTHGHNAIAQLFSSKGIEESIYKTNRWRKGVRHNPSTLLLSLGIDYVNKWQRKNNFDAKAPKHNFYFNHAPKLIKSSLPISHYDHLFMNISLPGYGSDHYIGTKKYSFFLSGKDNAKSDLVISLNDKVIHKESLIPLLKKIKRNIEPQFLKIEIATGRKGKYLIIFTKIWGHTQRTKYHVRELDMNVLIKQ